jgi:hypothetical protein
LKHNPFLRSSNRGSWSPPELAAPQVQEGLHGEKKGGVKKRGFGGDADDSLAQDIILDAHRETEILLREMVPSLQNMKILSDSISAHKAIIFFSLFFGSSGRKP